MASKEGAERKVLRVDDLTENDTGVDQPQSSTRSAVADQNPGVRGPQKPEDKFAASYQRVQEIKEETRQEMATVAAQPAVVVPTQQEPVQAPISSQPEQLQSDLSLLVTTGRVTEEAVVGGFKFVLRTLTAQENNEVLQAIAQEDDELAKLGRLRLSALAKAIGTVNGVPLENIPGADPSLDILPRKEALLGSFQLGMLVRLFDVYSSLMERSEAVFGATLEQESLIKN